MFVAYPGADGSTLTIADPKPAKSETIIVKAANGSSVAIPARRATPAFMFNSFIA